VTGAGGQICQGEGLPAMGTTPYFSPFTNRLLRRSRRYLYNPYTP
jgi:hypothetical protein